MPIFDKICQIWSHVAAMKEDARKRQKQARVYFDDAGAKRLEDMANATGQSEAWCSNLLVAEGLKALEAAGYKFQFPLKLEVACEDAVKAAPTRPKTKAA